MASSETGGPRHDPGRRSRRDERGKPRARSGRKSTARGLEPNRGGGGLSAASRRLRLDARATRATDWQGSKLDRERPPSAQASRTDPGGSTQRTAHDGPRALTPVLDQPRRADEAEGADPGAFVVSANDGSRRPSAAAAERKGATALGRADRARRVAAACAHDARTNRWQ